jgi:hypothetical protein
MSNNRGRSIKAKPATIGLRPWREDKIELKRIKRNNGLIFWVYLAIAGLFAWAMLWAGQYFVSLLKGPP